VYLEALIRHRFREARDELVVPVIDREVERVRQVDVDELEIRVCHRQLAECQLSVPPVDVVRRES
jgi:hypothetical protein